MKHLLMILALALTPTTPLLALNELCTFNSESYHGWIYNRKNFVLSPTAIATYKISIYKAQNGDKYSLTSPLFDLNDASVIQVNFDWKCDSYDQNSYDILKASPSIEILDAENNIIQSNIYYLPSKDLLHNISIALDVPQNKGIKVRIISHDSDIHNNGAIKRMTIKSNSNSHAEQPNSDKIKIAKIDNGIKIYMNNEVESIELFDISSGINIYNTLPDGDFVFIPIQNQGTYLLKIGSLTYKFIF